MLKIITVLATTFLFAGLLIAHPYTSPSVDPVGSSAKITTGAPAQIEPDRKASQSVAAERSPPSQTTVASASGGNSDAPGTRPARPQLEQPRLPPGPPYNNRYAALNAGTTGSPQPAAVVVRPPTWGSTPANRTGSVGPRRDGRHWPQRTDVAPSHIDPPSASPGVRVVFPRPMPIEERIHLEHGARAYWP